MGSTFVSRREAKQANKMLGMGLPTNRFYLQYKPSITVFKCSMLTSLTFSICVLTESWMTRFWY